MKRKFLLAALEIIAFNLLALFLVYKFWLAPHISHTIQPQTAEITARGLLLFAGVSVLGMLGLGFHIYSNMIKPSLRSQEMLKAAAEESERAENIRKEFVANVSHEIKTPLTSIMGFIETLQTGAAENPEIRTKFIDIIAIETARLKRLIDDLLVLSDIESKKETIDFYEIDLQRALADTVQTLELIAAEKQVAIFTEYNAKANITGDLDRFKQMMVNLIENAIKYSNEGGRVWVLTEEKADTVRVIVRDEGIGIGAEHLDRLFERFYRVDKSRSKKVGGTGLGLSIVKHIAALLNAELQVESVEDKGTTFYVIFKKMERQEEWSG